MAGAGGVEDSAFVVVDESVEDADVWGFWGVVEEGFGEHCWGGGCMGECQVNFGVIFKIFFGIHFLSSGIIPFHCCHLSPIIN